MALSITSWNMQGAGCDKLDFMCNVYTDFKDTNILLLQETGNPKSENGIRPEEYYIIFGKSFKCVAACEDETAKAKRCTTAILLDEDRNNMLKEVYTISITGYRPAIVARFDDCVVATIHAPANYSYNTIFLNHIYAKLNYYSEIYGIPWIFMGDMNVDLNVDPSKSFPFQLCNGAKARPDTPNEIWIEKRTDVRCKLMFPIGNTQGSNGNRIHKLDYAFLSSRIKDDIIQGVFNKTVLKTVTERECLSDHNMIGIVLYLAKQLVQP